MASSSNIVQRDHSWVYSSHSFPVPGATQRYYTAVCRITFGSYLLNRAFGIRKALVNVFYLWSQSFGSNWSYLSWLTVLIKYKVAGLTGKYVTPNCVHFSAFPLTFRIHFYLFILLTAVLSTLFGFYFSVFVFLCFMFLFRFVFDTAWTGLLLPTGYSTDVFVPICVPIITVQ